MKKIFTFLAITVATWSLNAQFVDFNLEIWKGIFAVADIDNDVDLDVIVSGDAPGDNENGAILINDGTGNFTAQTGSRVITAGRGGNIRFGDIDGDGDLDVIFAGWGLSNAVKAGIALNDGQGVFTLAPTGTYPVLVANKITSCGFADFDLNGLLDYYFFGNGGGNCVIYYQQTNGSFTPVADAVKATARYTTETTTVGDPIAYNFVEPEVSVIDFNKDGYPDIWINAADLNCTNTGEQTQRFSYLFANDGFGNLTQFSGAVVPFKKANGDSQWGDFNGDGYPDMLLHGDGWLNSGENNDRMYRIFKNNSGNAIQVGWELEFARQGSMQNGSIVVDWDNDGKLDLFGGGWNGTAQVTELYTGNDPANFTFTKSSLSFQGASEQGLLVADLNGDNKVDLLLNGYCAAPLNKRAAGYIFNQSATASVAPGAPTALNATITNDGEVMVAFTWTAPASETGKYGTTYNLSLKNVTTGKYLYNPMAAADGKRKVGGRMGNVFTNKSYELYNLPAGNYEWTVQAINGAYLGGAFGQTKTFTIDGETTINEVLGRGQGVNIFNQNHKLIVSASNDKTTGQIEVYAISGNKVAERILSERTEFNLAQGVYVVKVTGNGYKDMVSKVIVQ
ncbi:MAG: FG-GAP-like repeat-containing protein [Paludibacteraceae bacterium]